MDCLIKMCGKEVRARGWCHMHYMRWQRHGDPLDAGHKGAPMKYGFFQSRFEWRKRAIEKLGAVCVHCGYDNPLAFEFDHVNGGGRKEYGISGNNYTFYRAIALGERKDIQLLCANCNRIKG